MNVRKAILKAGIMIFFSAMISVSANAADVAAGKAKASLCVSCHGLNGISSSPTVPNLAGQKAVYLAKAVRDFKTGARKNGAMSTFASMIADADIDNIAAYYESLK